MISNNLIVKKSENLLLIGNGFDLSHHLPTSYSDFIHVVDYISKSLAEKKPVCSVLQVFRDLCLQKEDKVIEKVLSTYSDKYDVELDPESIEKSFSEAASNEWFCYLKETLQMKETPKGRGWVDFESEIKKVVDYLSFAIDHLIEEKGEGVFLHLPSEERVYGEQAGSHVEKSGALLKHICFHFAFFFDSKAEYDVNYIDANGHSHPDNAKYKIHTKYFERPFGLSPCRLKKEEIIDELFSKLLKLSHMLRDYLRWFVDMPVKNLKKDDTPNECLLQTWPWTVTQVISFNYTHTLGELYGRVTIPRIHFIHGKIDPNSEIVLGVDADKNDEVHSINTDFIQFKKYFQRTYYETDLSYLRCIYDDSFKEYDIYVIGHSLDVTDREIITETFNRARRVCIFFHDENARKKYIRNLVCIFGKEAFESMKKCKKLRFISQDYFVMKWSDFQEFLLNH